jgi:hypothetical protein
MSDVAPRALVRACTAGELVRVRRGAYVSAASWEAASDEDRHVLRVAAATALFPALVLSHESAAVAWGMPRIALWDDAVHVVVGDATGGRSTALLVQHTFGGALDVAEVDGIRFTGAARTVVDLALRDSFASALATADWALRYGLVTHEDLRRSLDAHPAVLGRERAERVLRHADGRSESVGESLSRARMIELGVPLPELQVEIDDDAGRIGRVDFEWQGLRLVGEFDGRAKYRRDELLRGRDPGDVVWDEKRREDRLRATGRGVVRWTWAQALHRPTFAGVLRGAGLRPRMPSASVPGRPRRGPRRRRAQPGGS